MNHALKSTVATCAPSTASTPSLGVVDAAVQQVLKSLGSNRSVCARHLQVALTQPLQRFLRRSGKGFRAQMVNLGWQIAGGLGEMPHGLAEVIELIHAGSMIVDDIEDGSLRRRGQPALHRIVGTPMALNAGNALYFAPLAYIDRMDLRRSIKRRIYRMLCTAMWRCHVGQALDLSLRVDTVPRNEMQAAASAITLLKTGSLMAAAATLGAIAAGGDLMRVQAIHRFGKTMGVALQMYDDLGNLGSQCEPSKRCEDLRLKRVTWPWAFVAQHGDATTYAALLTAIASQNPDLAALSRVFLNTLGETAQSIPHQKLCRALRKLCRVVGHHPALGLVEMQINRLRVSYN